eukprot:c224_g1_i1.p1 GENE.c224_g1_i1~~c224_g1_i1.p1  ORF type:complete len:683 (-),score=128.38 c224_g1_i1:26-2074(-)
MNVYLQSKVRVPLQDIIRCLQDQAQSTDKKPSVKKLLSTLQDFLLHYHSERCSSNLHNTDDIIGLFCTIMQQQANAKDDRRVLRMLHFIFQEMAAFMSPEASDRVRLALDAELTGKLGANATRQLMALQTVCFLAKPNTQANLTMLPTVKAKWKELIVDVDHKKKFWSVGRGKVSPEETDLHLHLLTNIIRFKIPETIPSDITLSLCAATQPLAVRRHAFALLVHACNTNSAFVIQKLREMGVVATGTDATIGEGGVSNIVRLFGMAAKRVEDSNLRAVCLQWLADGLYTESLRIFLAIVSAINDAQPTAIEWETLKAVKAGDAKNSQIALTLIVDRFSTFLLEKRSSVESHIICRTLNSLARTSFPQWRIALAHPLFQLLPPLSELVTREPCIDVRYQALVAVLWLTTSEATAHMANGLLFDGTLLESLHARMISGLLEQMVSHVQLDGDVLLLLPSALSFCQHTVNRCPQKLNIHAMLQVWTIAFTHSAAKHKYRHVVLQRCLDTFEIPLRPADHLPLLLMQTTTVWFLGEHANELTKPSLASGTMAIPLRVVVQRLCHLCTFGCWQMRRAAAKSLVKLMFRSQNSIQFEIFQFLSGAITPESDETLGLKPIIESAVQLMDQIYRKRLALLKNELTADQVVQLHRVMLEHIRMFCDVGSDIFPLGNASASLMQIRSSYHV